MSLSFLAATVWSIFCSTLGGLTAAALRQACPHCSPALHCPALSCHCGSAYESLQGSAVPTCTAAPGCSLQLVAAAYAAGLLTAAFGILSFKLWVRAAWVAEGGLALGEPLAGGSPPRAAAAAPLGEPSPTPRRALPAPAAAAPRSERPTFATAPSLAVVAAAAVRSDDAAVWRPRRS